MYRPLSYPFRSLNTIASHKKMYLEKYPSNEKHKGLQCQKTCKVNFFLSMDNLGILHCDLSHALSVCPSVHLAVMCACVYVCVRVCDFVFAPWLVLMQLMINSCHIGTSLIFRNKKRRFSICH